ncbi:MAG: insulinase family protein, partial [Clostridium sp.]|nr:insulinase family protein [Clostridium sp.]
MKRKFIAVLLTLSMVTTTALCNISITAYAADNGQSVTATVSKAGDELYGFKVVDTKYNDRTKCNEILMEHEKTGAKILIMKNNDKDRGFCVGFNTPSESDKGINHILEHSLLGGSEKYPTSNLIFNVMNSTYTSFINAMTFQNSTIFPVCSQSEDQLMKLTDIYMDSVYNPLIAKDEKVFEREAWRYEMDSADSPLTVNGIVYNEMRGNYGSIDYAANENDKKTLFKDTNQKYDAGGVPDTILDLSYDEFLNTYKKNYNPSNSYMILYGDVDYGKYLKMLDENYLSKYDKKEVTVDRQIQKDFNGLVENDYEYPVASDAENTKSIIDVTFAMDDIRKMSREDYSSLSLIGVLLNNDSSDFKKALKNSGIGEDYSISLGSTDGYQPSFTIRAKNADPSKKKDFYNLVKEQLNNAVTNGVNRELAESAIKSLNFSYVLGNETGSVYSMLIAAQMNMNYDDPTVDLNQCYKNIQGKLGDGYLENTIKSYLLDNKKCALVTTTPKQGLLEENNKKLADKLAAKKSAMSSDEINNIVSKTKEFKEWNSKDADQSVINSMKAVTANDIPVEVKNYNINETENSGIKTVDIDTDINDIGFLYMDFDLSHLSKEELHYLEFYCNLINNNLPTKTKDINEVINRLTSDTASFSLSLDVDNDDKSGDKAHPTVCASSFVMNDDIKSDLSLYNDVILNSVLDESSDSYIKTAINDAKQNYKSICSSPRGYMSIRSEAYNNLAARYRNYFTGIDYNDFIQNLEKDYNSNPQSVLEKLKAVRDKAFGKKNLTVLFAGNKDGQTSLNQSLSAFTDSLSDASYEKASVDLPVPAKREALSTNSTVQTMFINSSLKDAGADENGSMDVMAKLLDEKLLLPQIRLNGGAYTVGCDVGDGLFTAYTARDNDYYNSMNVISGSGSYMKDTLPSITPEILDNYIISTFAGENGPQGEMTGAVSALIDYTNSRNSSDKKKLLEEIKSTDINSLKDSPELLDKLNENSNYIVSASPDAIEAHKD